MTRKSAVLILSLLEREEKKCNEMCTVLEEICKNFETLENLDMLLECKKMRNDILTASLEVAEAIGK